MVGSRFASLQAGELIMIVLQPAGWLRPAHGSAVLNRPTQVNHLTVESMLARLPSILFHSLKLAVLNFLHKVLHAEISLSSSRHIKLYLIHSSV